MTSTSTLPKYVFDGVGSLSACLQQGWNQKNFRWCQLEELVSSVPGDEKIICKGDSYHEVVYIGKIMATGSDQLGFSGINRRLA
jgi:hypothetical protein